MRGLRLGRPVLSGGLALLSVVALATAVAAPAGSVGPGKRGFSTHLGTVDGLSYFSEEGFTTAPPGTQRTGHPDCAEGTRVTGGGVLAAGPPSESALSISAFYAGRGEWYGGAVNLDDASKEVVGYAVCKAGALSHVRGPLDPALRTGETRAARVSCPRGTRLLGGGGALSGPGHRFSRIVSTYPVDDDDGNLAPDDGWRTRAYKISGGKTYLKSYAICIDGADLHYPSASPGLTGAACDADAHVTGGGIQLADTDPSQAYVSSSRFGDGGDGDDIPDDLWLAGVGNTGEGIRTVYAICLG